MKLTSHHKDRGTGRSPGAISPLRHLRTSLLIGAIASTTAAHAQAIFAASEEAGPGQAVSVRGDGLDLNAHFTVYEYGSNGQRLPGVRVAPTAANGFIAMFKLPSTLGANVYELSATTSKGATNSVFINRPRLQWIDVSEAMPDGLVRLVGRNFKPSAARTPVVTLKNAATNATLNAPIVLARDGSISFRVPTATPVGSYRVSLNNGLSGSASVDPNTLALTVVAKGNDPFNLGVSWGADFDAISKNVYNLKTDPRLALHAAGNGVADDAPAFRNALIYVQQHGGGTLYLPSGTYRVDDGTASSVRTNVVLNGDGKGRTILQVGYRYTPTVAAPDGYWPLSLWGEGGGTNGIANLSIVNLNGNSKVNGVLGGSPYWLTTNKSFLKSVEFKLNNGTGVSIPKLRKGVIADCDVSCTALSHEPIRCNDTQETQILRNTFDYRVGRVAFNFGVRDVLEGNTAQYNNAYQVPGSAETGGIELSCGQQVLAQDNTVSTYGGLATKGILDGELMLTQLADMRDFCYVGMVKSATSRLLIPIDTWPSTNWLNKDYSELPRTAIMIISGKGAGQWRRVTTWNTNSVMIDRPWQIIPDTTSRYAINAMPCYQQAYLNNRLTGGMAGVMMWDGALDTQVSGNVQINSGVLLARGDSFNPNPVFGDAGRGSNIQFDSCWDVSITENTLVSSINWLPACISVTSMDRENKNLGLQMGNVDVRNNTIRGNFMTRDAEVNVGDGIQIQTIKYDGIDRVSNVGTVVENNNITGATKPIQNGWGGIAMGVFDNATVATEF